MAAPTLETNAAADTLRITGGNSGNPVTWNDVWDWDDGGGSSGGDGDVPKDGGGTAKVNTFMTETVADVVYLILKNVDFGDGIAPTYFTSKDGEMVYFIDEEYPKILDEATVTLGEKANSESVNGAYWSFQVTVGWGDTFCWPGSIFNLYGSKLFVRDMTASCSFYETEIKQSIICGNNYARGVWFYSTNTVLSGQVYFYTIDVRFSISPTTVEDVHVNNSRSGINATYTRVTISLTGTEVTNYNLIDYQAGYHANSNLNVIDPVINVAAPSIGDADSWIKEQYTCNIHIADKDGADLGTVNIKCEDKDDNEIFSVDTDASGDIAEQIITYKKWEGTEETLTTYSPHKFTISKAGIETLVLDNITVDHPIVWHLELLPALAEGDVRDGVAYGEDSEGNLELPAVGDVEDGVGFGSDGVEFTGTFGVPPEADVEDGVGYGAGGVEFEGNLELPAEEDVEVGVGYGSLGTEFEGTYLGLRGNNLTAVLEKSVALTGYLEKKVSLTGELKS